MQVYNCPLCGSRGVDTNPQPSMTGRTPNSVRCENIRCILGSPTVRVITELWNSYPDVIGQHRKMREVLLDIVEDNVQYQLDKDEMVALAEDTLIGIVKI